MAVTIALQEALRPSSRLVAPELAKFSKQYIFVNAQVGELKVEIDHSLQDFDSLPLTFDKLKSQFKIVNLEVLPSMEKLSLALNLMSQNPKKLKREFEKIHKKLYEERVSKKISLETYKLSVVYLNRLQDYFSFGNIVLDNVFSSKDKLKIMENNAKLVEKFGPQINDYVISFITFFCLLYLLEKKKKILKKETLSSVNFYSTQLSIKHNYLVESISGFSV